MSERNLLISYLPHFLYTKPKIFVSSELELLQMISKLDYGWCIDEDVGPLKEVNCEIPRCLD